MSLVSIVLLRYFGSNSVFFFSTVSFSNEDNHCQLYATLDFVKFIVSICEQTNDLSFTDKSAFWTSYFFFSKSCLKVGGAAYTRVRLIHESLRYSVSVLRPEVIRMETGLPTKEIFNIVVDHTAKVKDFISYYAGWKVESLAFEDQIFITLMHQSFETPGPPTSGLSGVMRGHSRQIHSILVPR